MLEGNIITVNETKCTIEFQPSADMSWQSWSNNEVNQAATHPSPYANVNKSNMLTMGGSIGLDTNCTWKPYTNEIRKEHVKLVETFSSSLPSSLSDKVRQEDREIIDILTILTIFHLIVIGSGPVPMEC